MLNTMQDNDAGSERLPASVKVWDPFVRVFHWSLVVAFAIAYVTGDELEWLHLVSGYVVAALIAARILWGFVGPETARFSSFVKGPRVVLAFIKKSARLEAPRHLGHNPAGGAMIVALLLVLVGLSVTGHMTTLDAYWGSEVLEEVHEAFAHLALILVGLHVLGVAVASLEHGENLVRAMVTGRKRPLSEGDEA